MKPSDLGSQRTRRRPPSLSAARAVRRDPPLVAERLAPPGLTAAERSIDGERFVVFAWPTRRPQPVGLTTAEHEILHHIRAGKSNHAIAVARASSIRTVANQVAGLLRKLGAGSRFELIQQFGTVDEAPTAEPSPRVEAVLACARDPPLAAIDPSAAWAALVRGEWAIIDSVVRDGQRIVVARDHPPDRAGPGALTASERDVAWLAALGNSYKVIAYELGMPLSTTASRLRRVVRKLGARSRGDLLVHLGARAAQK